MQIWTGAEQEFVRIFWGTRQVKISFVAKVIRIHGVFSSNPQPSVRILRINSNMGGWFKVCAIFYLVGTKTRQLQQQWKCFFRELVRGHTAVLQNSTGVLCQTWVNEQHWV
jgi:hypothetical protein